MADKRGREHRKSHAKGVKDVRQWLAKWWGEDGIADFRIRKFKINVQGRSYYGRLQEPSSDEFLSEAAQIAFRKQNESDLHKVLKFAAWYWLQWQPSKALPCQSMLVRMEQRVYFPLVQDDVTRRYHSPLGGEFDETMAQVIRRGDDSVVVGDDGIERTLDVYGKGTTIEVGNTQPSNLLLPMEHSLAERAIWVPFPVGLEPADFDFENYKFSTAVAYEITWIDDERELE